MRTFATSNHQVLAGLGVATLLVTAAAWLVWLSRHPLHALQELGCDVPALVSWLLVAGLAAHAVVRRQRPARTPGRARACPRLSCA